MICHHGHEKDIYKYGQTMTWSSFTPGVLTICNVSKVLGQSLDLKAKDTDEATVLRRTVVSAPYVSLKKWRKWLNYLQPKLCYSSWLCHRLMTGTHWHNLIPFL